MTVASEHGQPRLTAVGPPAQTRDASPEDEAKRGQEHGSDDRSPNGRVASHRVSVTRRGPRGYWPLDKLEWPFQRIVPHLQLYHTCKLHHTWRSRRRESNKSTIHTDAITRGEYSHPRGNHIRGRGYDMSAFPPGRISSTTGG